MNRVAFEKVSKQYHRTDNLFRRSDLFFVIQDMTFSVENGETLGLIGLNGAGKTTLIRLMAGIIQPTHGKVFVQGRIVPLIGLNGCLHPFLNARENIWFLLSLYNVKSADKKILLPRIVDFSGLSGFMEMPVKNFSNGMRSRLAFSVAAHLPSDLLLIDEILAVGDAHFQSRCLERLDVMKKERRTMIFVSHQMEEIKRICDRVLWLDKGRLHGLGDPSQVVCAYEESTRT